MCFHLDKFFTFFATLLLKLYRWVISPFLHSFSGPGMGCRFEPSCSHYAEFAIKSHGFIRGGILALFRVCRCNPFSAGGIDPVPGTDLSQKRR